MVYGQLRLIVDLAANRSQLCIQFVLNLRQALAIGQQLPPVRQQRAHAANLGNLLLKRAANRVHVNGDLIDVSLHPPDHFQTFLGLRIVGHHAQSPFVLAQGFGKTVVRHQAVAIRQQFTSERQVLYIQQSLLHVLPGQDAVAFRKFTRLAVQTRGLFVVACAHKRVGAVIGDPRLEGNPMIGHDAADQVVFGFFPVFQGCRVV